MHPSFHFLSDLYPQGSTKTSLFLSLPVHDFIRQEGKPNAPLFTIVSYGGSSFFNGGLLYPRLV